MDRWLVRSLRSFHCSLCFFACSAHGSYFRAKSLSSRPNDISFSLPKANFLGCAVMRDRNRSCPRLESNNMSFHGFFSSRARSLRASLMILFVLSSLHDCAMTIRTNAPMMAVISMAIRLSKRVNRSQGDALALFILFSFRAKSLVLNNATCVPKNVVFGFFFCVLSI